MTIKEQWIQFSSAVRAVVGMPLIVIGAIVTGISPLTITALLRDNMDSKLEKLTEIQQSLLKIQEEFGKTPIEQLMLRTKEQMDKLEKLDLYNKL